MIVLMSRLAAPAVRALVIAAIVLSQTGCRSRTPEGVAQVNGHVITAAELDRAGGQRLHDVEQQRYGIRVQKLDLLIAERLLADEAAKRKVSVDDLLATELAAKATPVSESEVNAYCAARPGDCGDESSGTGSRRAAVRDLMQAQRLVSLRVNYIQQLRDRAAVVIHLQPPEPFRAAVGDGTLPPRGPATAPITIVEFSDFHCPFCKRVQPTLEQLLEKYPTQIRLVYRDNPIDQLHPNARKVSEAARCANDLGRFWEFHDEMYLRSPNAGPEVLRAAAEAAGADPARIDRCVAAGTHRAAVQADVDEAAKLGADGTPAFFINGRSLRGLQSYETFVRVIEEELRRVRR